MMNQRILLQTTFGMRIVSIALLLDIDPIDLARGKRGNRGEGGLFDYVNDRPYVASSFLSTAISKVFGTAMKGKCTGKSELEGKSLPLTAKIAMLPCRGEENIVHELFEPLAIRWKLKAISSMKNFLSGARAAIIR